MPYDKAGRFYPKPRHSVRADVTAALVGCTAAMMAGALVILIGYLFGRACG